MEVRVSDEPTKRGVQTRGAPSALDTASRPGTEGCHASVWGASGAGMWCSSSENASRLHALGKGGASELPPSPVSAGGGVGTA